MLFTFTSKVAPDVVMFGNIATELLQAMGQAAQKPGILRGADIKVAADRLRAYLDEAPQYKSFAEAEEEDEDKTKTEEERTELRNRVGLRTRALPLLELLDASYAKEVDVIWR